MTPRTPVHIAPTYVVAVRPETKAGAPVCSLACLGKWQVRLKAPLILGVGSAKNRHCSHCSVCATAIRIPEQCVIHGEQCPTHFYEGSIAAADTVTEVQRLKPGPIGDDDFQFLLFMLRNYPDNTPAEIAFEVVQAAQDACADDPDEDR